MLDLGGREQPVMIRAALINLDWKSWSLVRIMRGITSLETAAGSRCMESRLTRVQGRDKTGRPGSAHAISENSVRKIGKMPFRLF